MQLHFMQTYQSRSRPQSASVLHGFPLWLEISWKTFNERKQKYDGFQRQLKKNPSALQFFKNFLQVNTI